MQELSELTEARKVIYTPLNWGDFCITKNLTPLDCRQGLLSMKPLFGILIPGDEEYKLLRKAALAESKRQNIEFTTRNNREMLDIYDYMRNDPDFVELDLRVQALRMGANYIVNLQHIFSYKKGNYSSIEEYLGLPARHPI